MLRKLIILSLFAVAFLTFRPNTASAVPVTTSPATPAGVAINEVTNTVYVANYTAGTVAVINGATGALITTITVGSEPRAVAVNPVTDTIYVANYGSSSVSVINGANPTAPPVTIGVGTQPYAVAVNPVTNTVYVANSGSGNVTEISAGNNNSTTTLTVQSAPEAVAVNVYTGQVFVANSGSGSVSVISGSTVANATVGTTPTALAVNSVTNTVYVANSGSNTISVIAGGSAPTVTNTVTVGSGPAAVAVDPVTNLVYVANLGTNSTGTTVSVINGTSNLVTNTVTVGTGPTAVAVNPLTNTIYVSNGGSSSTSAGSVSAINGATNSVTTVNIAAGDRPYEVAVNPVTNKIYAAYSGSPGYFVLDGATNTTATLTAGTVPIAVAVNPVTNTIYVGDQTSNNVTVINGANNTATSIAAGTGPHSVAVDPVTNQTYVADQSGNTVTVISGATVSQVTGYTGTSPNAVAVNPVTGTVYVTNGGTGTVSVISEVTNAVTGTITLGGSPNAVAVDPATNTVYVTNNGSTPGTVAIISGGSNTFTTVNVGNNPNAVGVDPVTNTIYVTNNGSTPGTVSVISGMTNAVTQTVNVGTNPTAVAINSVTGTVYVANNGSGNISVIAEATNTVSTTLAAGSNPVAVAVNPVSNKIYVANIGSSNVTVINGATTPNTVTATVPAGTNPAAVAVNPETGTIYMANSGSGNVTVITEQQVQTIPLEASITAPTPGTVSGVFAPLLGFTATSTFAPYAPSPCNLYFQIDTWQGPWTAATPNPTNECTGDFTGQSGALQPGLHILYAFATDGQDADSSMANRQQGKVISTVVASPFVISPSNATVAPPLNFGTVTVNTSSAPQAVTITNNSGAPLTISSIAASTDYSESNNCPASLSAGASCSVEVTFTPTVTGTDNGTLTVTDDNSGVAGTQQTVALTGIGGSAVVPLTITAGSTSMTYGGTVPTVIPLYTYGSFTLVSTPPGGMTTFPICTTTAISSSPVGTYTGANVCTGAVDSNYTISYAAGTVTVQPAPLTITASSGSMTYGGTAPSITASFSGFVNGDSASSLTTPPVCSTTANSSSPASPPTYPSNCSRAVNANYTISYVAGSVAVNPAPLTITANSASKTYGQMLTLSGTAFIITAGTLSNGDSVTSVTLTSTGTASSATVVNPGPYYPLVPSAAVGTGLSNYIITYQNGTLTVNPLTITASIAANNKGYDGTTAATITNCSIPGAINGDNVGCSASNGQFASAHASASPQNVTGTVSLTGTTAGNYMLSSTTATTTATITPAPASVTPNPATRMYGTSDPIFTGTLNGFLSGDGVTATYSRAPAGQTVGSYTISAVLSATGLLSNYNVTYNTAQFTITPAPLTITASSLSMTYGGTVPAITASYSGFVAGDSVSSLSTPPTCSASNLASSSPVGSYPTSCTGAAGNNYTITYSPGSLTVGKATLIITASSGTMIYGGTVPAIMASYSGFVAGDSASSLTTQPTCSAGVTSSSLAGTYSSICSGATDSNYTISYVSGSVIVNAAAPTVAAVGGTFAYNGNQEAASATALGIGNVTVAGTFLFTYSGTNATTYGPSSTPPTNVGTYSVAVLFTSTDPNYANGSASTAIVITPGTPVVVVASSDNPSTSGGSVTFTATVSSTTGTPTGTIQFIIDGTNFGPLVTLSGGTATSPATTSLPAGEHVVTAIYSGDGNFVGSSSLFLVQVVNNPLVSIAVTPANPSIFVSGTEQFAATGTFTDATVAILPTGGTWAPGNTMSNAVSAPMAAAGGNGLLYYFGGQDGGGPENYVQTYNPATGAWGSGASMTTARYQGVAVAPGNGLIYVIGGLNNSAPTNVVEAYNPATNTWTSEVSMSHVSACSVGGAVNGLIYVLTGCDTTGVAKEFDVYNPATNTWTILTSPAHAHNSGAGGVIGGKFFVAGGYDSSITTPTGITEVYDPQTSSWSTLSPMTAALGELGGAVSSGNLYLVGGLDGSSTPQPDVYVYNASTDSWSQVSSSLSAGRSSVGVLTFDGLLYTAGGSASSYSNTLEVFDTDDVTWSSDTNSVATVDPNAGLATGDTPGTAAITAASRVYSPVSGNTQLTVTKQNQTITFGPLSNVTYGATPFSIGATDSASLQLNFTSNTLSVCTVAGGTLSGNQTTATVTVLAAGNCSITASQAGTTNYNAASSVTQNVTVNQALLTVTASSGLMTYGSTPATVTATYSGFVNGDTVVSLTTPPTCSTTATGASHVSGNPYASICSGASDSNYSISYVNGTLNVNPTPLTVTASSGVFTYGGTPPTITGSASGFVNGDTAASLAGLTCSTTATSASHVSGNPYTSTCSGGSDNDYSISYANGIVNVNPAPLTVTASNGVFTYGGTPPTITASGSGFVNGDSIASLAGLSCSTTATSASHVSGNPYKSTCSGASAGDYSVSYVNGRVNVNAAPLSITASSGAFTYGGVPPTITPGLTAGSTFVGSDSFAGLLGLTCSTVATSASQVGGNPYASTCSGASDSDYSITYVAGTVNVNPAPLTVTASNGAMTYGGTVPTITPTYSGFVNGQGASVVTGTTCSTTATASSPIGSYPSSCTGATAANYTITPVNGSVSITAAALTVTASSGTMTYGGTVPTITPSYSGFVNGQGASVVTGTACSTTATASSPIGSYPSSCTGATAANYTITPVNGSVSVTAALLTIKASNRTMTYGSAVPTITASYSGFVNGDTGASLTTAPTCSTTATSSSPAGPYNSTCWGAADSNYAISYVSGTVTVGQASLVISASSGTMTYGGTPPSVTASYSGFVNGDTPASLTTAPACTTTATSSTPVGTDTGADTCSGAVNNNYNITYVAGNMTVGKASLTISASSGTMTYGGTPPSVTPGYSGFVNGDTAASLTTAPTCSTTATSSTPVGTDTGADTCTGAVANNYNITYLAGNATITTATLVITASSSTTPYGTPIPAPSPSYSGFVNGDLTMNLTTPPTCATSGVPAGNPMGTYTNANNCSGAVDHNYNIVYMPGTAKITPVPLSITANTITIAQGAPIPPFTVTYSGFVNGDSPNSLNGTLVCTTIVSNSTTAGSFPITCVGQTSNNYVITYYPGTLTITPANNVCGLTQGFWKNHASNWPVISLVLGSQTYTQTELLNLLNSPSGGDASLILAKQLIAAKLNVANGTNPATAGGNISNADSLLSGFSGKLPNGVSSSSSIGTQMTNVGDALNTFNSDGVSQPGCVQPTFAPLIAISPTCVSFGGQALKVTSKGQTVTISNNGNATLTITGIKIVGTNSGDFSETNNCTSLSPPSSCTVTVTFTPQALGPRTAVLQITDNASGSPQTVGLSGGGATSITSNFNGTSIAAGNYLWFNSVFSPKNLPSTGSVSFFLTNGAVSFTANSTAYNVPLPDSVITLSSSFTTATTAFDAAHNRWVTTAPLSGLSGNLFLDAVPFQVPAGGLPGGINPVTFSATFTTNNGNVNFNWQYAAAVYLSGAPDFASPANYNNIGVKPTDDNHASQYQNSDHAGTPENEKPYMGNGGAMGGGGSNYTGSYSGTGSVTPTVSAVTISGCTYFGTQLVSTTSSPMTVTLTNNQTVALGITSITVGGDFSTPSNTCGSSLAAGASCAINVTFSPTVGGTRTGTLTVTDNASSSLQTVNLSGDGN